MFSQSQLKIAFSLIEKKLDPEGIVSELEKQGVRLSKEKVLTELNKMKELELLEEKNGVFSLKPDIQEKILKRKSIQEKDAYDLRLKSVIEIQAITEELVDKQLDKLLEGIKKDKEFTLYDHKKAEVVQLENEYYSSFLELNFSVKSFQSLIRFMFFYGPSSVEVIKPDKVAVPAYDLQEGLIELAEMIHKYSEYVARLLSRKELEEFNKKLHE